MIATLACLFGIADPATYLLPLVREMEKAWPGNRTVTVVCHGHSVPAGYFVTPDVRTFDAYPHLLHEALKKRFPLAVVNVVVTAIGGEDSVSGAARFTRDVLPLRPDLVTVDYALNDRGAGLAKAKEAWVSMVRAAKAAGAKVLLLTPTPDQRSNLLDEADPLSQHAAQVREIAAEEEVGLCDPYARFQAIARRGPYKPYMSQVNHPNRAGHEIVLQELERWFPRSR